MQILELYLRNGTGYKGTATSTSTDNLVDLNTNFTIGVEVGYIVFNQTDGTSAKVTAVTNATTLALSDNIFTSGEKYIVKSDFVRLDLFEDESVTITDTIKNVKDIAKVFTPFSQQFNVPASKHNSKLFKHYEDFDILNSFDARVKVDALIKLNGSDYKKGKARLQSVSLKNNKPHAYKLVFFGDTVELKDVLGEADLSSLIFADSLNFTYDFSTVSNKFQNVSDVCFPLITHTKLMRYNNNAYVSVSPTAGQNLNFRDIKPALKVRKIIDAISAKYSELEFTGDFLNTEDFNSIYLWLHREKGFSSNADPSGSTQTLQGRFSQQDDEDFTLSSGNEQRPFTVVNYSDIQFGSNEQAVLTFDIRTTSSEEYTLTILDGYIGTQVFSDVFTGNSTPVVTLNNPPVSGGWFLNSAIDIVLTCDSTLSFTTLNFTFQKRTIQFNGQVTLGSSSTYTFDSTDITSKFYINRQLPKMKIIDFLTNLFKLFNLVAFKKDNKINIIPLEDFYNQGVSYDITKYVDVSKTTVSKLLQYRNINFNFKSKKSFLVEQSDEIQGNNFAGETFGDITYDGGDYKVEPDFEKMMYERLTDETDGALTNICQGAMLDKDFNPTIGKPLLMYIVSQTESPTFVLENPDGSNDDIGTYNRPSQVLVSSGAVLDGSAALNYGVEADEFFREPKGTNLLEKYYLDYISNVFNRQSRILKTDAYLPLHIILNYGLNDKFVISNKTYRINSIKTNLLTNKSSLELYTLTESVTGLANAQVSILPRLAALNVTATSSSSVTLGWTAAGALNTDNITGYDVYKDDTFVETLGNDISGRTLSGLTSKITYKLAIRTRYTIDSNVVFSDDRIVYATTD